MTLLRILRNLAVLVILAAGGLSLANRPAAAQSVCKQVGSICSSNAQCCVKYCGFYTRRCCVPEHNRACTNWTQCCSGQCVSFRCL